LNIPDATCPIEGWNCYCGAWYALQFWGHGYETARPTDQDRLDSGDTGAECMGVMYSFSVGGTEWVLWILHWLWIPFSIVAMIALPFGRKRARCDHHTPSLWNSIRRCFGRESQCVGNCVMSETYNVDCLMDDLAWTIYVLDVGIWCYLFLSTLLVVVMFIWTVVLWVVVILTLIVVLIAGLFMGGGEVSGCDINCCAGDCCVGGDCGGLVLASHTHGTVGDIYWAGLVPNTPWYHGGGDDCCCSAGCCRSCCAPLAFLVWVFPVLPENAWGGIYGYFFIGTHHMTPEDRLYTSTDGGNQLIEFLRMGWLRPRDNHSEDAWRTQVYNFLQDNGNATAQATGPRTSPTLAPAELPSLEAQRTFEDGHRLHIGPAHAVMSRRSFSLQEDRCVDSSFDDYKENRCWICQEQPSCDNWDLWLSCRHLYCSKCSTKMLQRRMPCPLCRVASSVVLRGDKWMPGTDQSDNSNGTSVPLLSGQGPTHGPL